LFAAQGRSSSPKRVPDLYDFGSSLRCFGDSGYLMEKNSLEEENELWRREEGIHSSGEMQLLFPCNEPSNGSGECGEDWQALTNCQLSMDHA
jgi:hypothetical protein